MGLRPANSHKSRKRVVSQALSPALTCFRYPDTLLPALCRQILTVQVGNSNSTQAVSNTG
jgi:hypothetical protein